MRECGLLLPFLLSQCTCGHAQNCVLCSLRGAYSILSWCPSMCVGANIYEGVLHTLRVAVFPPVLGPVMMTLRSSGRTQMLIGTGGRLLSRSSDSLSLPSASESTYGAVM